eukprot:287955-Chlamydomonas_euryale.AAC.1
MPLVVRRLATPAGAAFLNASWCDSSCKMRIMPRNASKCLPRGQKDKLVQQDLQTTRARRARTRTRTHARARTHAHTCTPRARAGRSPTPLLPGLPLLPPPFAFLQCPTGNHTFHPSNRQL